jgi:hypothetical protein
MKLSGLLVGIAVPLVLAAPAAAADRSTAVADWTRNGHEAIATATKFPAKEAVYMGIVSATIYDAAVWADHGYRLYGDVRVKAPPWAARDASVTAAAHDMLVALFPEQHAQLDALATVSLEAVPPGRARDAGVQAGRAIAAQLLAFPAIAGAITTLRSPEHYTQTPPGPGVYEPTGAAPIGTTLPDVPPLALASAAKLRPPGPPPTTSAAYAQDLAEVALLGRRSSTARTAQQTATAWFWTDLDVPQWNRALVRLAASRRLDAAETARMLALANVAGGDAMIACFDSKYSARFWRPVQAIHTADPTWEPLFPTPPFPEYPSAHNCHSGAITQALTGFFGTARVPLVLDSLATTPAPTGCTACVPGVTHTFDRFDAALEEVENARVWAGFHFRRSDDAGAALGRRVGEYVADRLFRASTRCDGPPRRSVRSAALN